MFVCSSVIGFRDFRWVSNVFLVVIFWGVCVGGFGGGESSFELISMDIGMFLCEYLF